MLPPQAVRRAARVAGDRPASSAT